MIRFTESYRTFAAYHASGGDEAAVSTGAAITAEALWLAGQLRREFGCARSFTREEGVLTLSYHYADGEVRRTLSVTGSEAELDLIEAALPVRV